MYLVGTVTVDCRKVLRPGVVVRAVQVMHFHQVLLPEEESPSYTSPLLYAQQAGESRRNARVCAPPRRPVSPVPVVRTNRVLHFRVPRDRHVGVLIEGRPLGISQHPTPPGRGVPVTRCDPLPGFAWVAVVRPSPQCIVQVVVELVERLRAHHCALVVGPSGDGRVEQTNEIALLGCLVPADALRQLRPVALHRLLARCEQRFEAAPRAVLSWLARC